MSDLVQRREPVHVGRVDVRAPAPAPAAPAAADQPGDLLLVRGGAGGEEDAPVGEADLRGALAGDGGGGGGRAALRGQRRPGKRKNV